MQYGGSHIGVDIVGGLFGHSEVLIYLEGSLFL